MPSVTVRNVPDEVHRAIRVWAAQHGHSIEAEMGAILESAVRPQNRVKLGSMLAEIGRKVKLIEFTLLEGVLDRTQARAASFE